MIYAAVEARAMLLEAGLRGGRERRI
jgi:hypothetical protein